MSRSKWRIQLMAVGVFLALSGCASNKTGMSKEEFTQVMSESNAKVDALLERGESGEAITILSGLAKQDPSRKEPWARMAKIQFDSGNYAQAIVSAEEVLQRDNTDRMAKSIRVVAGLRVASQSVADLRNDVELKGNARSDAANLATVMRETLGEEVLVPPAELEARKRREAAAAAAAKAKANNTNNNNINSINNKRTPTASREAGQPARSSDPFGQLR